MHFLIFFIYNINPNHNFNQTYHDMIFNKKKSQTIILTKHTFYMNQP